MAQFVLPSQTYGALGQSHIDQYKGKTSRRSFTVSSFQHIGGRKTQEDTFVVAPELPHPARGKKSAFFGVFDGTVGDFASVTVKDIIVPTLMQAPAWGELASSPSPMTATVALSQCYNLVDRELLKRCADNSIHYATCTSVTALVVDDIVAVAHTGDARLILGRETDDGTPGEAVAVTIDHTPDLPEEKARIEKNGGEVVRLQKHSNKPYIRGGDFMMRKALGEQPMQLQYARAFGCKDLKIFGLTCEPEVTVVSQAGLKWLILGSDGIWGVVTPRNARDISDQAASMGKNPSEEIVRHALKLCDDRGIRSDNLTALCIEFHL